MSNIIAEGVDTTREGHMTRRRLGQSRSKITWRNVDTHDPRYTHDCLTCTFLGRYGDVDVYYHKGTHETVIARSSSEGSDYASGWPLAETLGLHEEGDILIWAALEARRRGLTTSLL